MGKAGERDGVVSSVLTSHSSLVSTYPRRTRGYPFLLLTEGRYRRLALLINGILVLLKLRDLNRCTIQTAHEKRIDIIRFVSVLV